MILSESVRGGHWKDMAAGWLMQLEAPYLFGFLLFPYYRLFQGHRCERVRRYWDLLEWSASFFPSVCMGLSFYYTQRHPKVTNQHRTILSLLLSVKIELKETWTIWTFCGISSVQFSSVRLLSRVRLFATPWIAARQASLASPTPGVHSNSRPSSR